MATKEEWKPVVGYEGLYEVSSKSRIRNINGRLLTPSSSKPLLYPRVGLTKNKKAKTKYVHRLVAKSFVPNPLNKNEVNHIDGDKTNNRIENLEWVTRQENMKHAVDAGLSQAKILLQGEKSSNAKLTENQVIEIRRLRTTKEKSVSEIASMFSISQPNVSSITLGYSWKHLL